MAGFTTSTASVFKPLPSVPNPHPLSLSLSSRPFGLRRRNYLPVSNPGVSSSIGRIAARYGGGGGGYRPSPGDSKRPKNSSSEDDQSLDIYSIRSDTVRLIDEEQNMVGIVSKSVAIQRAEDAELDLVILSPDADPPVVRIMDYNKYKYELQKKKRDQQKKSAALRMDQKEIKMGYNIDVHDYSVRLKAAQKFLRDGDKVKVIVSLKGREREFRSNAIELLRRFQNDIGELATEESENFKDKNMTLVLVPNKAVVQKELPKKKLKAKQAEVSASV